MLNIYFLHHFYTELVDELVDRKVGNRYNTRFRKLLNEKSNGENAIKNRK